MPNITSSHSYPKTDMSFVIKAHAQREQQTLSDTDTCSSSTCSFDEPPKRESRNARRNRLWRERRRNKAKQQQQQDQAVPQHLRSRILALDCEMVGVGRDGLDSCLARATLIDFDGHIVYDQFVRPSQPVTDYRTYVSGIRAEDLEHGIDLETCRAQVSELLKDAILIGHALRNDLYSLGLRHPWQHTRDTAKYEPFMKHRNEFDNTLWPRKLKELVQEHLDYDIQLPGQSHSPYDDALAALNLYKKHWRKWEKVMDYKVQRTNEILSTSSNKQ